MKALITLAIIKRDALVVSYNALIDPLDIVAPVRDFTSYRQLMVRESDTSIVEYHTSATMDQIKVLYPGFVKLTANLIDGRAITGSGIRLFVVDRIAGAIRDIDGTHSEFHYKEEGGSNVLTTYRVTSTVSSVASLLLDINDVTAEATARAAADTAESSTRAAADTANSTATALVQTNLDHESKSVKISLSTAQVKTLHSVPMLVVAAPGVGKAVVASRGVVVFTHGDGLLSLINIEVMNSTASKSQLTLNSLLNPAADASLAFDQTPAAGVTNVVANDTLVAKADADSAAGTGSAILYVSYKTITL